MIRTFTVHFQTAGGHAEARIDHQVASERWQDTLDALPGIVAAGRDEIARRGRASGSEAKFIGIIMDPDKPDLRYLAEGTYTNDGGSWAEDVFGPTEQDAVFQARWVMAENERYCTPDEVERFASLMRAQKVEVTLRENAPGI